jgi:hypothetical protein
MECPPSAIAASQIGDAWGSWRRCANESIHLLLPPQVA